jgi:hypothetical protein
MARTLAGAFNRSGQILLNASGWPVESRRRGRVLLAIEIQGLLDELDFFLRSKPS